MDRYDKTASAQHSILNATYRFLKTLLLALALFLSNITLANTPGNWGESFAAASCGLCDSADFHKFRQTIAQQTTTPVQLAGASGYVIAIRAGAQHILGRMSLVGLGNIGTSAAHVLIKDNGKLRHSDDGKLYFQPMLAPMALAEIDIDSAEFGCTDSSALKNSANDWVNVKLKHDVFELAPDKPLFAALWNYNVTNGFFHSTSTRQRLTFVVATDAEYAVDAACTEYQPSPTHLGLNPTDVYFHTCPTEKGASGSGFYYRAFDNSVHLVASHLRSRNGKETTSGAITSSTPNGLKIANDMNKARIESLNQMYFDELILRGVHPEKARLVTVN